MADIPLPDQPTAPPPTVGRRLFLAGTAGAAALLATQQIPGAWVPRAPGRTTRSPSGWPPATRPRPGRCSGPGWRPAARPRRRHAGQGGPGRLGGRHRAAVPGRGPPGPHRRPRALAHAVHVEVDGLDPGRHYWYRFRAGGHLSRIGRTRTCPDPRRPLVRLDLAFVSCQNFEKGYYTAYRHLAEDDLDVVLHLGDYVYENPPRRNLPRRHVGGEPADLPGYRVRHALYRTDRDLQAAHARHPFVATWDDHEVENDYAGRHPVEGGDPAVFLRRRAAAYRACWEHMPLRRPPRGPTMPLFRRLRLGDLVELNLLDTRQYRDDQRATRTPAGAGWSPALSGSTPAAPSSAATSGAGCWTAWTAPRPAGTCSPSRWSWPSWTCTQVPAAPGGATPGTATRPRRPGGGDRAGRDLDQLRGQQEQRLPEAPA
jgi:PhoD-like phosphatase/PhoD-like phosphatase, N-terminal domain